MPGDAEYDEWDDGDFDGGDPYTGECFTDSHISGRCSVCAKECVSVSMDVGIGPYEFWGAPGNDICWIEVSPCCEAEVLPPDCQFHGIAWLRKHTDAIDAENWVRYLERQGLKKVLNNQPLLPGSVTIVYSLPDNTEPDRVDVLWRYHL